MPLTHKEIQQESDFLQLDVAAACHYIDYQGLIPQDVLIHWLMVTKAYWKFDYQGDPTMPHAQLTSGKHSDGFINCLELLKFPQASAVLAYQLAKQLREFKDTSGSLIFDNVDWVFGSPMAGISFAYEVASKLGARYGFTDIVDRRKVQKRFNVEPGQRVLLVEELITTMKTAAEQAQAIAVRAQADEVSVNFAPLLGVFLNRSGETEFKGWPIVSVIDKIEAKVFEPDNCPMCKGGSKVARLKDIWAALATT